MQATEPPSPQSGTLADWLRLEHTPGVGLLSAHRLLTHFRSPQAIFAAPHEALCAWVRPQQATALLCGADAPARFAAQARLDAMHDWLRQPGRHWLALDHPAYPETLRNIPAAPLLLHVEGRLDLLSRPALAMVGSRNASSQGLLNAERLAQALAEAGLTIVSGLALGIDGAAHRGGLRGAGSTVAVVGTGIDIAYPARNRALAERIAAQGCIVSEYALGTPPQASNFPKRNRVISGLARGVLVVEATRDSGSLITARLAAAQGRDVYAIPGSIHSALVKGCHTLIREGAKLVESAADILEDFGMPAPDGVRPLLDDSFVDVLLRALGDDPAGPDALAGRLGLDLASVQGQLLVLELAGLLERLPGGMFQRLRS